MNCCALLRAARLGRIRALASALVLLPLASLPLTAQTAAPSGSGVISGSVSNQATRENLQGVHVRVVGTNQEAYTDRDGTYALANLAPGTYQVSFEYTGLDRQQLGVVVQAGQTTRQDVSLTAGIYKLDAFTVGSTREGNAAALVEQKEAVNVKNVVTSDAFGNIAKGNIGNFLKRLPGIATVFDEVDSEQLILRGMPAAFSTVEINGTRAASGEPSTRTQFLGEIPTDTIEKVEVIKATTPDVDADSMAGRVNLITKSALDYKGQHITARLSDSYSPTYGREVADKDARGGTWLQPSAGASYSNVFGKDQNIGVFVDAYLDQQKELRGTTQWNYVNAAGGTPAPGVQNYIDFNNASIAHHFLLRAGASTQVDYRASPELKFVASLGYNSFKNDMDRARQSLTAGTIDTAHSGSNPYFAVVNGAQYAPPHETRDQVNKTYTTRLAGDYKGLGNGIKADFDVTYSGVKRREYRTTTTFTSNNKFAYALDRYPGDGFDQRWPAVRVLQSDASGSTAAQPSLVYTGANPFADPMTNAKASLEWQQLLTEQFVKGSHADVSKDFDWIWPVEIKTGARWRETDMDTHRNDFSGTINSAITDLSPYMQSNWDEGGALNRYPVGTEPSVFKVGQASQIYYTGGGNPTTAWHYNPAFVTYNASTSVNNSLGNDKQLSEEIQAVYLMGTVKPVPALEVLFGVRLEHTNTGEVIPVQSKQISDPVASWTGRIHPTTQYTDYFPSLNIRYTIIPNLVLHASVTKTIGRPDYGDILTSDTTDSSTNTITVGNLDLKPRYSTNYDASLEYYYEPAGVISVGVFQDHITDFAFTAVTPITSTTAASLGFPSPIAGQSYFVSQKVNGGWALNTGVEFNWQEQFRFLPGLLSGLGANANFTYLHVRGTYDRGATAQVNSQLQGFIPRTANAGLFYEYGKVDVKLLYNFTDTWLESYSTTNPSSQNQWRGNRYFLDAQTKYRLTQHVALFADFQNFTHQDGLKYEGWVNQIRRWQTNGLGFTVSAGVSADY